MPPFDLFSLPAVPCCVKLESIRFCDPPVRLMFSAIPFRIFIKQALILKHFAFRPPYHFFQIRNAASLTFYANRDIIARLMDVCFEQIQAR